MRSNHSDVTLSHRNKPILVLTTLTLSLLICGLRAGDMRLFAQAADSPGSDVAVADPAAAVFQKHDLLFAGIVVGTFLAIPALEGVDQSVRSGVSETLPGRSSVPRTFGRSLGALPINVALTSGAFVVGALTGNPPVKNAGLHSLQALLLAGAATQAIKWTTGRPRPNGAADPDEFHPLSSSGAFHSFPSGHTSATFAIAATVSSELRAEAPWVPYIAYPLATWTATTRVLDRKHWLTDIVAGAALGILASRVVERFNHRSRRGGAALFVVTPGVDGGIAVAAAVPLP